MACGGDRFEDVVIFYVSWIIDTDVYAAPTGQDAVIADVRRVAELLMEENS